MSIKKMADEIWERNYNTRVLKEYKKLLEDEASYCDKSQDMALIIFAVFMAVVILAFILWDK